MKDKEKRPAAPLKPRQLYDVAVIGCSLPGLVAAALLAGRGLRVLHVDHGDQPFYEAGGFLLPRAPTLLPHWKSAIAFRETIDDLNLVAQATRIFEAQPLQILEPRRRTELGADADERARELTRSFGQAAAEATSTLRDATALFDAAAPLLAAAPPLPDDGILDRFALSRLARKGRAVVGAEVELDESRALGRALLHLHAFASRLAGKPSAFSFARATGALLPTPHRADLFGILHEAIRSRGGDCLGETGRPVRVESIELSGSSFAALQLKGGAAPFRARALLAALPASTLASLLPEGRRRNKLDALTEKLEPAERMIARGFVLPESALPRGLGNLALDLSTEGGPVLFEVSAARSVEGPADPELRTVAVYGFDEARVAAASDSLLPFRGRALKAEGRADHTGFQRFSMAEPRALAVEGLPVRTPYGRVLLASSELLPGLGIEGDFLAGRRLADLTAEMCRKVKPLG